MESANEYTLIFTATIRTKAGVKAHKDNNICELLNGVLVKHFSQEFAVGNTTTQINLGERHE